MPPSPIKIIGHAASLHNDLVLWEEQEEGHQDKGPPFMLTSELYSFSIIQNLCNYVNIFSLTYFSNVNVLDQIHL